MTAGESLKNRQRPGSLKRASRGVTRRRGRALRVTEHKKVEEAVRESEDRLRRITDNMLDMVVETDLQGVCKYASQSVKAVLGYAPEDLVGKSLLEFVHPEDLGTVTETIQRVVSTGRLWTGGRFECRYRHVDGHYVWLENLANIVYDEKGQMIGGVIGARDITERKQAEEKLRQSVERYHSLFDRMLDGMYRSTHEGRFVDVNPAFVKMFGYSSKQEMLDIKDIAKELYFSPQERGSHILDTGQDEVEVYRMRRKDGSEIWVEDHGHYVHDEQGNIVYHEGIMRDITERKRAEEALRESQSRYKALFEDSPMPLWLQDQSEVRKSLDRLKNSGITNFEAYFQSHPEVVREVVTKVKILDVNQAASSLYEAPNKEAYKEGLARLFTEESFDSFRKQLVEMAEGSTTFRSEYTTLTFSGIKKRISLTWSVAPGYEESFSRVFVSTIDITDRKRMEDELKRYSTQLEQLVAERTGALQKSEKKYRQLIETAQEGLFTYDTNGTVTFVNPFLTIMVGHAPEEMIGKSLLAFVDDQDVSRVKAGMERRRLGIAETYEVRLIRKDGSRIYANVTVSPITDEGGKFAGGLALLSDITERRKLEAQLVESQRLAAIGEAAAMVGHDLRNPLQAMTGALYLAKRMGASEKTEDRKEAVTLLESLDDEIQYIDKIVSDLQDYARPVEADRVETSLPDQVRAAVTSVKIPGNVEVTVNVGEDLSNVKLDPALFRRVLTNLVLNAVQAMPEGGRLTITGSRGDESFAVAVQDTGVGIAPENLGKVFTPFFTTKAQGQGLGLAVCKRLMEAQGGTIEIASQVGEGSTFTIKIPTNRTRAAT
jgi:PAS domain S-box-containing protein